MQCVDKLNQSTQSILSRGKVHMYNFILEFSLDTSKITIWLEDIH